MYQKIEENGYIVSIARGVSNGNITAVEYDNIRAALKNRPEAPSGYHYCLKTDLTWDLCELPPVVDAEISNEELGAMLEAIL